MTEPVLQVAVPVPIRRRFDYLPPRPGWTPPLRPGVRVRVPFGHTSTIGVVVGIASTSAVDAPRLKRVCDVIDAEPLLDPATLKLLTWASDYFQHPVGEVVVGTLPKLLRLGRAPKSERSMRYAASPAGARVFAEGIAGAPVQARLLRGYLGSGARGRASRLAPAATGADREGLGRAGAGLAVPARRFDRPILNCRATTCGGCGGGTPRSVQPLRARRRDEQRKDGGVPAGDPRKSSRGGARRSCSFPRSASHRSCSPRFQARLSCRVEALHSGLSDGERLSAWTHRAQRHPRTCSSAPAPRSSRRWRGRGSSSWMKSTISPSSSRTGSATPRATSRWCAPGTPERRFVLGSATPVAGGDRQRPARPIPPPRAAAPRRRRLAAAHRRRRPALAALRQRPVRRAHRSARRGEGPLGAGAPVHQPARLRAPAAVPCLRLGRDCGRCDAHLVLHHADGRLRCTTAGRSGR